MARLNTGERKTIRNAAIAGAAITTVATAAALGARHVMRERAVRPNLDVAWGEQPHFTKTPDGEKIDFSEYGDKGLKHHLAVLSLNHAELQARLKEDPAAHLAVALADNDGAWHTGLFRGAAEERLTQSPRDGAKRVIALRLGSHALDGGVYMGIVGDDGHFRTVKTEIEDVGPVGVIKHEYADLSIMTPPPEDLFLSADKQRYVPIADIALGTDQTL